MNIIGNVWNFVRSEEALALVKVAAAVITVVHSIEAYRQSRRRIGFAIPKSTKRNKIGF